jgi:hypothetical protein
MLIRPIAFLSLCLFSQTCFAQDEQVSLQFVSFPKLANAKPVELLIGDGKTMKVELPTNCLSPVYKVNRLNQWVLGKSSTGADDEFVFDTYGKVASIASAKQLVLVIRKGANDSDGFELILMSNQHSKFGGGMYFFMNAAKVDIAVKIGDQKFALKPRAHKLVQPKPSKVKGKRKYLYTYIHFRKGTKAIPFYESTWRFSEKARCMVFLYHDTHTHQLRTHTIRDYIQ